MVHWIDEESESSNVIVTSESSIFIGSCDKEAYSKVDKQLSNQDSPIEVFGTDDLTTIPFNQIQNIVSRNTDKDIDIRYKAKKDIEEKTIFFNSIEKKKDFISSIDQYIPEHLSKTESEQSVVTAAISPLVSLILSLSSAYLFFDKFRWPAIIIGSIWALASVYMLLSRIKEPPTITRWSIRGRYFRKMWSSVKAGFSYTVLALVIVVVYGKFPDTYGQKSIYDQIKDESLSLSEIETLISRGADINYKGEDNTTALATALSWGDDELAIALIKAGADLSIRKGEESPLEYAIYNDSNIEVIESMLKGGASLEFDIEGITPLDYSKQYENVELEKLLGRYLSSL